MVSGDQFLWEGYQSFVDCSGVGTAILLRNKYVARRIDTSSMGFTHIQCTAVGVGLREEGSEMLVISIYVPTTNCGSLLEREMDLIASLVDGRLAVIGGDFNTNRTNCQWSSLDGWVKKNGDRFRWHSPIRPTFVRSGGILDHFLPTTGVWAEDACTTRNVGLEHKLICAAFFARVPPARGRMVRKWHLIDQLQFAAAESDCLWTRVPTRRNLTNGEIDQIIALLTSDLNAIINTAVPLGWARGGRFWGAPPWLDYEFRLRRKIKRAIQRERHKRAPDRGRIREMERVILSLSRTIRSGTVRWREQQIAVKIAGARSSADRFRAAKAVATPLRSDERKMLVRAPDGTVMEDAAAQAGVLSEYYRGLYARREVGDSVTRATVKSTVETVERTDTGVNFNALQSAVGELLGERFTTCREVRDLIRRLPNKTSCGRDGVPNVVVKRMGTPFVEQLTAVLNHCLRNAYFPASWKEADVVVIPKRQGVCGPGDFRPISITPCLSKILESIILRRLEDELRAEAVPRHQFGFRKGVGTVDALASLVSWAKQQDAKKFATVLLAVDVKKAFDSVWTEGVLHKAILAGASAETGCLVLSFLRGRNARVRLGGCTRSFPVERGVPQGSRLGPLLFNLYVADMSVDCGRLRAGEGKILQFADDTLLLYSSPRYSWTRAAVPAMYASLSAYMDQWGIEMAVEKTQVMFTAPRGKRGNKKWGMKSVSVGGVSIDPGRSLRYLGVTVDRRFHFRSQAESMGNRGRAATGRLTRVLKNKEIKVKIRRALYMSLVRSVMVYAGVIWASRRNVYEINVAERWALRHITGRYRRTDGRFWPNSLLYEEGGVEEVGEHLLRLRERCTARWKEHPWPEIRQLGNEAARLVPP